MKLRGGGIYFFGGLNSFNFSKISYFLHSPHSSFPKEVHIQDKLTKKLPRANAIKEFKSYITLNKYQPDEQSITNYSGDLH
jgi:hypothetical protein